MTETAWTHLSIVAAVLIPVLLAWGDMRRRNDKDMAELRDTMARIETKVEPLWNAWTRERNRLYEK